jgi:hypothetical protein
MHYFALTKTALLARLQRITLLRLFEARSELGFCLDEKKNESCEFESFFVLNAMKIPSRVSTKKKG